MTLTVAPFRGDAAAWDAHVRASAGWTHFHRYGWRSVIEQVFGHECVYLSCADEAGTIRGVLPLVWVRSRLFGRYLVSMPFLNYGGPLGSPDAVRRLVAEAVERAQQGGARLLELRCLEPQPVDLPVSHRKVTVTLDLPDRPDALMAQFKAKLRSQIRRAAKEGAEVRFGADQVAPFYEVFVEHMRDLGTPAQPRRLFESIAEIFPDDAVFGCVYLDGAPVACGAGFEWDGQFEMTWASALRSAARAAPNMTLYWAFMERAIERGLRVFNFGRCTPGGGTHRFKRQWTGADDVALHWYQHGAGAATPSPEAGAYAWGPRVWRRLPLWLTRLIGPPIVRSIP